MTVESPLMLILYLARLSRTRLGEALAQQGIHPGQDQLLMVLWDYPGIRPTELAARLQVEPPTVTRMLDRLQRGGLVQRTKDPDDKRAWRIDPTPRSRILEPVVRQAWQQLDSQLNQILGEVSSAELRKLLEAALAGLADRGSPSTNEAGE